MTIALPLSGGRRTVAEVNLKFIWDVVDRIKIGRNGKASVVDRQGALVAHPDIGLVLRKTTLGSLDQVRAALSAPPTPGVSKTWRSPSPATCTRAGAHGPLDDPSPALGGVRRAADLEEAFEPLPVVHHPHRSPRASGGDLRRGCQPDPGPANGAAHPRDRGRCRQDRSRRPGAPDPGEDRRRDRGPGGAVQPDDRAAPGVLCHPGAEGRGAHPRAHRGAGAANGHRRNPARDQQLADGCPARLRCHCPERPPTL